MRCLSCKEAIRGEQAQPTWVQILVLGNGRYVLPLCELLEDNAVWSCYSGAPQYEQNIKTIGVKSLKLKELMQIYIYIYIEWQNPCKYFCLNFLDSLFLYFYGLLH